MVDVGAEAMLNRRPEAVDLAREVGLGDDLVHPATISANLWNRGRLVPMPRTLMGVPLDLRALDGVISAKGVARAAMDTVLPPTELGDRDISVGDLVEERLGKEVVDRLVEPLLGGVYAGHAREISARAAVPQLVALLEHDRSLTRAAAAATPPPSDGRAPVFAGIRGGVGRLAAALADSSRGAHRRDCPRPRPPSRGRLEPRGRPDARPRGGAGRRGRAGHAGARDRPPAQRRRAGGGARPGPHRVRVDGHRHAGLRGARVPRGGRLRLPGAARRRPCREGLDLLLRQVGLGARGRGGRGGRGAALLAGPPPRGADSAAQRRGARRAGAGRPHRRRRAVGPSGRHARAAVGRGAAAVRRRVTSTGWPRVRRELDALPGLAVCGSAYDGVGIPACIASAEAAAAKVVADLATMEP